MYERLFLSCVMWTGWNGPASLLMRERTFPLHSPEPPGHLLHIFKNFSTYLPSRLASADLSILTPSLPLKTSLWHYLP